MKKQHIAEIKALNVIELRGYKLLKREEKEDIITLTVKYSRRKKAVILCILNKKVVGVAYARKLKKLMDEIQIEKGIIVADARYTAACRKTARTSGVELIPRHFPSFNIFKHELVPKHEILPPEKAEDLLKKYRVKPYQLPKIKASDVAVIALGAKQGDIIKVIRKSQTAGKYIVYRHVVP